MGESFKKQGRPQRPRLEQPQFSLAGRSAPTPGTADPHNTYFSEGYRELNPWTEQEQTEPFFSLTGTFPHVLRRPQRKNPDQDPKAVEPAQKGQTEPAPQVESAEAQKASQSAARRREEEEEEEQPERTGSSSTVIDSSDDEENPKEQNTTGDSDLEHVPTTVRRQVHANTAAPGEGKIAEEYTTDDQTQDRPYNKWSIIRQKMQMPLAEWLGTTVAVFIGCSANLAVTTSQHAAGDQQTTYWAWGFGIMLGIYISGGGSGGFLNPALVVTMSVFRGFPAKRIPKFVLAELLGAFCGALLAFAIYRDSILHLDGALIPDSTGTALFTSPKPWIRPGTAFLTEVLASAVLGCAILALGDSSNAPPAAGLAALIIGLLFTTLCMAFGYNTSACLNPVRDLGPRLAALAVGYPASIMTARSYWWLWGPWVAPVSGALLGALVYDACMFKGGESPVNYSWNRWRVHALKEESHWLRRLGRGKKADDVEMQVEGGNRLREAAGLPVG